MYRAVFLDRDLLTRTRNDRDASDFGQHAQLTGFSGNFVSVRRGDGAVMTAT